MGAREQVKVEGDVGRRSPCMLVTAEEASSNMDTNSSLEDVKRLFWRAKHHLQTNLLASRKRGLVWATLAASCCLILVFLVAGSLTSASSSVPGNAATAQRRVGAESRSPPSKAAKDLKDYLLDPSMFAALDSSSDGMLTEGEIAWEMQKRIGRHIKRCATSNNILLS